MKPNGKNICAALKQVRKRVADTNGIVYTPKECHFEGDCNGTCPACEAEVRYLEHQLSLLRKAGKVATVMGVAVGVTMVAGCKSGNANATSTTPQRIAQCSNLKTDNNISSAPDTLRTDTGRTKREYIFGDLPKGWDSTHETNTTAKPSSRDKIAPAKLKKKNNAQTTPQKNKKKGRRRR